MAIQGKEGQQQVGHEFAHIKGNGPIECKLGVYGIGGVLSDHEAACVHVTMQQGLGLFNEFGLQGNAQRVAVVGNRLFHLHWLWWWKGSRPEHGSALAELGRLPGSNIYIAFSGGSVIRQKLKYLTLRGWNGDHGHHFFCLFGYTATGMHLLYVTNKMTLAQAGVHN